MLHFLQAQKIEMKLLKTNNSFYNESIEAAAASEISHRKILVFLSNIFAFK